MKEDYLWDKKGSDAEIERLEGLLSGFRYVDEPAAPSNVVEFPDRRYEGRNTHWMIAIAASVAIGAVAIGAWTLSSSIEDPLIAGAPGSNAVAAPNAVETQVKNAVEEPAQPILSRADIRPAKSRNSTHKAAFRARPRHRKPVVEDAFTKDELQAYNQLMLALSITGSKLQIVKDSVNGTQESEVNNK